VLDYPAGGIGLGSQGCFVAFISEQDGLQLRDGLLTFFWLLAFKALGEKANGVGELLGFDAQLPEGTGALERASRTRGDDIRGWGLHKSGGDGGENGHGMDGDGMGD
jgi:hypothetical protein